MKITFEAESWSVMQLQIIDFIGAAMPGSIKEATAILADMKATVPAPKPEPQKAKGPKNKGGRPKLVKAAPAVEKPVEKPVGKPVRRLDDIEHQTRLTSSDEMASEFEDMKHAYADDEPDDEPITDPAKLAAIRVKTTEDLQAAYSSGKHKQVLELLATYGNGAKSFRELTIKDFLPIRKAIDEGALQ